MTREEAKCIKKTFCLEGRKKSKYLDFDRLSSFFRSFNSVSILCLFSRYYTLSYIHQNLLKMSASLFRTITYSISLFIGPFLAGQVPLAISLAPAHQILLTTYAAGLLTGTALITILPEGQSSSLIRQEFINWAEMIPCWALH
jgi:hypothetical protein